MNCMKGKKCTGIYNFSLQVLLVLVSACNEIEVIEYLKCERLNQVKTKKKVLNIMDNKHQERFICLCSVKQSEHLPPTNKLFSKGVFMLKDCSHNLGLNQ